MQETSTSKRPSWIGLTPLLVFLLVYLVASVASGDFYKMPIAVAFLVASGYALAITRGMKLEDRILQFSRGAADTNILLMIWIFILAGAFAGGARSVGAVDATVDVILSVLPPSFPPPGRNPNLTRHFAHVFLLFCDLLRIIRPPLFSLFCRLVACFFHSV